MEINPQRPLMNALSPRTAHGPDASERSADSDFFAAALSAAPTPFSNPGQAGQSNLLIKASEQLELSKKRMEKGLRALGTGRDEKAKRDYPLMLSDTMLTTQVLLKGVSSTVQLVEKISNLQ
jgi:hypothetical protein